MHTCQVFMEARLRDFRTESVNKFSKQNNKQTPQTCVRYASFLTFFAIRQKSRKNTSKISKMRSRSRSRSRSRDRRRSPSPRRRRDDRRDREKDRSRPRRGERDDDDDRRRPFIKSERDRDSPRDHRKEHRPRRDDRRKEFTSGANSVVVKEESDGRPRNLGNPSRPTDEDSNAEPDKPTFELSGKLMEDTNVFNGVVIKYSEPEEARKPKKRWRFYVFKGEETLPVLHLHRQSAYLIGKDRKVADIPVDHPSCSRQHAVLQYRFINNRVLPYIIDLNSSNGTFLNNNKIDPQRYVELREKDVLKFGFSSREYVFLHENSDKAD